MSDRIDEIKARCEAATPGPWTLIEKGNSIRSLSINGVCHGMKSKGADAEFIAHASEDIPFLLGEIERLTAERDHLKYRAEKTREYLVRLQEALELFSAGKTAAGIIKSATLLALIDGETVQK